MTGPTGLVNFFVLEASDYVEQLDSLLDGAGPAGPDADALTRAARALRGSATMARRGGISALAAAVERLGRALRERVLPWTPAMHGSLAAAVADLRQLVRSALNWTEGDEERAQARTAELLAFAPPSMRAAARTPAVPAGSGTMFVVSGASDVAAALSTATSRAGSPELLRDALGRVRAFRGIAALRDHPSMARALDAVEKVARAASAAGRQPTTAEVGVLAAGAQLLRRLAEDVRSGRTTDPRSSEAAAFEEALARLEGDRAVEDRIVPVASLFHDDPGPHVVRRADAPGTTSAERFTLESAAAAEHVRRLVADARGAGNAPHPEPRADDRELGAATATLVELARSFDHAPLAGTLERALAGPERGGAAAAIALATADAVATLFTVRGRSVEQITRRVSELGAARALGTIVAVGYADLGAAEGAAGVPVPAPTPVPTPVPPVPEPQPRPEPEPEPVPEPVPVPTPIPVPVPAAAATASPGERPTGRQLHALLASGIEGIERMQTPAGRVSPAGMGAVQSPARAEAGDADDLVPVDTLLYRGRAALGRALELRDEIRQQGGPPDTGKLDEIFDLLELAASA